MDKSLDEVSCTRRQFFLRVSIFSQVIASRPKTRRHVGRRTSAKTQILGNHSGVAVRAAAQNAAAAKVVAAATPAQPADKIIVSNLPVDVNEVQIKVLG